MIAATGNFSDDLNVLTLILVDSLLLILLLTGEIGRRIAKQSAQEASALDHSFSPQAFNRLHNFPKFRR